MGKGKKGRKKEEDDDWENDIADIAKQSGIELNEAEDEVFITMPKKKEKKKKEKAGYQKDSELDDEFGENHDVKSNKPSFAALMMEDDDEDEHVSSDEEGKGEDDKAESESVPKMETGKEMKKENTTKGDKKKGKASKKKKEEGQDDLDAILADIENTEKKDGKTESKKSKKKGKHKQEMEDMSDAVPENLKEAEAGDEMDVEEAHTEDATKEDGTKEDGMKHTSKEDAHEEHSDDEGPKIKTAAQKRAEKKEREKQKKKEAKKKSEKQEKKVEEKGTEKHEDKVDDKQDAEGAAKVEVSQEGMVAVDEAGSEDEGEEGEGDKKKKKKKKKKGKDEEEKKKGKKPGKAAIKQMQEALEKMKLEEERLRQEEEEKLKAAEEAERQHLEKIRLEQERKERKKQKEKEKIERKKKEGKFLTAAQKEQKRRAEMMLEAMKQQGISVPSKDAVETRKKVQYVKKKKNQQLERQQSTSEPTDKDAETEATEETKEEVETKEEPKAEPEPEAKPEVEETKSNEDDDDLPESWEEHHDDVVDGKKEVKTTKESEKSKQSATQIPEKVEKERPSAEGAKEKDAKEEESSEESEESESEEEESDEEESSDGSTDESESSEDEHEKMTPEKIKEKARERIMKRRADAELKRSVENLRCPVICVLGHVDTGKTKILDKIRHTNVQDGEAGGITQQIGATMVPLEALKTQTKMIKEFQKFDLKLPGLLIIDTPGHESFSNLRTRGSSLCDMAILVVDIMHGLEPQTIESINLLRKKHTPFIVALNKIDRLFEWKRGPASQVEDTVKKQKRNTKTEFESRVQHVIGEFAEQGLNAELFFKNVDEKSYISLVPTSAHSGDGMGDLMALICKLTQTRLAKKLAYSAELQSTVMEVKSLPGLGTTVDAILVNGKLREGDTIVTGGIEGPIVTQIRAILTPQPLRELRVKSNYIQHKELKAAQGCKITGKDLEKVMAGAPIFAAENHDEIEVLKDEVTEIMRSSLKAIKVSDRGVYVQASTLGSLEALLEFLKTSKIPYSGVNVGPVHKRDVMKTSVMLEHEPMYAVVLAFDVKVEKDAQDLADKEGITIFTADIIYHLFDKFTAYTEDYKQKLKDKYKHLAVFPCKLRVLPQHIFNSRDPIVIGVNIESGTLRIGTPITVPSKEFCDIGVVTGIEANHKNMEKASTGQEVCIKIEPTGEAPRMYGRHFTHEDLLMSKISRESIDALKDYFRDEMSKNDWQLIIEMKKTFEIL